MTTLDRTHLQKPLKAQMAALAFAAQMLRGSISQVARAFEVSRPTVYQAARAAKDVLEKHFEKSKPAHLHLAVDDAHLNRCIVALRTLAPNSIRAIEHLIPILFPGLHIAYGKIHNILSQAEKKAQHLNTKTDLGQIQAIALDELFSQGRPVLSGIDLDSGFLLLLQDEDTRSEDDWRAALKKVKAQGLDPNIVVKDAGTALQAATKVEFKKAQLRFDAFHAKRELGQVHTYLERKAYKAIKQEYKLERRLSQATKRGRLHPRVAGGQLAAKRKKTLLIIERYDSYRTQMEKIFEALWYVERDQGRLRRAHQMRALLKQATDALIEMRCPRIKKVGRYIQNRIDELCDALRTLGGDLAALCARFGRPLVGFGCLFERLLVSARRSRCDFRRRALKSALCAVFEGLYEALGDEVVELLNGVHEVLARHHVASSAVEGFHAQLRPHLYVHKRVTRGFLELFRFAFNHRRRGVGREKQPSPYERLTGQRCEDWLSLLGYPPSTTAAA